MEPSANFVETTKMEALHAALNESDKLGKQSPEHTREQGGHLFSG